MTASAHQGHGAGTSVTSHGPPSSHQGAPAEHTSESIESHLLNGPRYYAPLRQYGPLQDILNKVTDEQIDQAGQVASVLIAGTSVLAGELADPFAVACYPFVRAEVAKMPKGLMNEDIAKPLDNLDVIGNNFAQVMDYISRPEFGP